MFNVFLHQHGQPIAKYPSYANWHLAAASAFELVGANDPSAGYAVHLDNQDVGGQPHVIPINEATAVAYASYIEAARRLC